MEGTPWIRCLLIVSILGISMIQAGCRTTRHLQTQSSQTLSDSLKSSESLQEVLATSRTDDLQVWEMIRTEYFPSRVDSTADTTVSTPAAIKQVTHIKGLGRKASVQTENRHEEVLQTERLQQQETQIQATETIEKSSSENLLFYGIGFGLLLAVMVRLLIRKFF